MNFETVRQTIDQAAILIFHILITLYVLAWFVAIVGKRVITVVKEIAQPEKPRRRRARASIGLDTSAPVGGKSKD